MQTAVAEEKKTLQPTDVQRLAQLDSVTQQAQQISREHLDRLLEGAPKSYFAKVVRADRALEGTMRKSPMDVAEAFDFSDAGLLRSSVYDKAVMFFLQNLNAVSEEQFVNAADTLMLLSSRDTECRSYMLNHLIDLFSTYGPELPLQHLIDVYVAPDRGKATIEPELRSKVNELLKVSVGAVAPDVPLVVNTGSRALSELVKGHRYSALFFYSSTCDHCHAQMSALKDLYATLHAKGFEVFGVALDADSMEFNKCIAENGLPWPSGSEFNGWGSQAAKAFQVKATPTFFLLDDRMRIVAKPFDAEDLREKLGALIQ